MDRDKLAKIIISERIVRNSFRKSLKNYLKKQKLDLKANEILTLYYILIFNGLTQKEMSHYLDYDLATAGRILESLSKKGLISRTKSKDDARRNDLKLTPKGQKLVDQIHVQTDKWYNDDIKPLLKHSKVENASYSDATIFIAKELTNGWDGTKKW